MKYQICVVGSAQGSSQDIISKARIVGQEIAKYDGILLTGAAIGLSYEAVLGAKEAGGLTVGIAPGMNEKDMIERFKFKPEYFANFDVMVFTGAHYKGRNVPTMRSCHAVVLISGATGTLGEYSIARDEGKLIGVLTDTGGTADMIETLETKLRKKEGAGKIIYSSDPKELVKQLFQELDASKSF